jgi:hypothetical protein
MTIKYDTGLTHLAHGAGEGHPVGSRQAPLFLIREAERGRERESQQYKKTERESEQCIKRHNLVHKKTNSP